MASRKHPPARRPAARGFTLIRLFDAPRSLVFAAWTQPKHLKRWSAPEGFTVPVSKGDLRPGGKWRACMVSERTGKLWLSGVYREIIPGELLVFTHAWENEEGTRDEETIVTVRFSDVGNKTKVIMEQTGFESADSSKGHKGGWTECLEKLATLLTELQEPRGSKPRKAR